MTRLSIEPMSSEHLLEVYAIEQQVTPSPWKISQFEQSINQHTCLVATFTNVVVGYLVYSVVQDESEIFNIAINPDYQRQGFAKQVFSYYQKVLPVKVNDIFLEVRRSNKPAIAFYQHFGFDQTGSRKNYYQTASGSKEDALLMHLKLPGSVNE